MSSTVDTDDVIEVTENGLTVRKRFVEGEFPVPVIRFEIESGRDESVSFRLTERIPPSFSMDGVGFHPDYRSDDWSAFQDNHLEFAGTLDPGESLVTVYGVRLDDDTDPEAFLTEPSVDEDAVDRPDDADAEEIDDTMIGDIIADDRTQPVKDMLSGEADTVPGLESTDESGERGTDDDGGIDLELDLSDVDDELESAEGEDDDEDDDDAGDEPAIEIDLEAAAASVDEGAGGAEPDADGRDVASATGSVATRLADELREGAVDEADRERIRSALGVGPSGSDVARIEHLQSRVEEVAAYAGALEAFLDEEGSGERLVSEFRAELASFEQELAEVNDRLDGVSADVAEVTDRVADLDDDLRDVESELEAVGETVTDVVEWRNQLGSMFTE